MLTRDFFEDLPLLHCEPRPLGELASPTAPRLGSAESASAALTVPPDLGVATAHLLPSEALDGWRELGATHIAIATMNAGLASVDDHIEAARRYKQAIS